MELGARRTGFDFCLGKPPSQSYSPNTSLYHREAGFLQEPNQPPRLSAPGQPGTETGAPDISLEKLLHFKNYAAGSAVL